LAFIRGNKQYAISFKVWNQDEVTFSLSLKAKRWEKVLVYKVGPIQRFFKYRDLKLRGASPVKEELFAFKGIVIAEKF
jgi:hypothetical protein